MNKIIKELFGLLCHPGPRSGVPRKQLACEGFRINVRNDRFTGMTELIFNGFLNAIIFLIIILGSTGCGVSGKGGDGVKGAVAVSVIGTKYNNEESEYGKIKSFRVEVSGEGIESPIIAEFDGTSSNGTIDGIPSGSGRTIAVDATNVGDKRIRSGEALQVEIPHGGVSEVEVVLESVPIFVNLKDDDAVAANRLRFQIFSESGNQLEVKDSFDGIENALTDVMADNQEFFTDVSTGLAVFIPPVPEEGRHVFTVRSKKTGRESSVSLNITKAMSGQGAPLFSAGDVREVDGHLNPRRLGQYYSSESINSAWPNILNHLIQE